VATPLLTTKLAIPPIRLQPVARPRLFEKLQEGLRYKLILVSAPAGFGKTTLLSGWVRQQHISTIWLSIDKEDSDPARFLGYLNAALHKQDPSRGEDIQHKLPSSSPPSVESLVTELINGFAGVYRYKSQFFGTPPTLFTLQRSLGHEPQDMIDHEIKNIDYYN
jgi:LuxR family maltose regulon positive regulatory protein